jgi:hypothetical protein
MRIERVRVFTSVVAIRLASVFCTMLQRVFTPFEYARFPINATLIPREGGVGAGGCIVARGLAIPLYPYRHYRTIDVREGRRLRR